MLAYMQYSNLLNRMLKYTVRLRYMSIFIPTFLHLNLHVNVYE